MEIFLTGNYYRSTGTALVVDCLGGGFLASYRLNNFFWMATVKRNFVSWEYRGFGSPIFL